MTREEKIKWAIGKGYICDPKGGLVYGLRNNIVNGKSGHGYRKMSLRIDGEKEYIYIHHFIWYWVNGKIEEQIDHIDRDRSNNRITNLRAVTNTQNSWNKESKGYYYFKRDGIYQAYITVNGERIYLGRYKTETEARQAYLDAKEKYHIISEKQHI